MKFGSGSVKTDDFDYYLPEELIAQTPLEKRDDSKLMVVDRETGEIKHEVFHNIIDYLNKDDILVLNDTKVLPARIIGEKKDTKAVALTSGIAAIVNVIVVLLLVKWIGDQLPAPGGYAV